MDWLEGGVVVPRVELPGVTSFGVIIGIAFVLFAPMVARFGRIVHRAMRACKGRGINSAFEETDSTSLFQSDRSRINFDAE
jgi:hypothetical protein